MINQFEKNLRILPKRPIHHSQRQNLVRLPAYLPPEPKEPGTTGRSILDVRIPLIPAVGKEKDGEGAEGNHTSVSFSGSVKSDVERALADCALLADGAGSRGGIHSVPLHNPLVPEPVSDGILDDCNDWGGLGDIEEATPTTISNDDMPVEEDPDQTTIFYQNFIYEGSKKLLQWIVPDFLACGGHPLYLALEDDLDKLRAAGIEAIISATDAPLESKYVKGMEYSFIPTVEGYSSHLREACLWIENMSKLNKRVFVHGFEWEDAATIAAAYLVFKNWLSVDQAVEWMRMNYSKRAITPYQYDDLCKMTTTL